MTGHESRPKRFAKAYWADEDTTFFFEFDSDGVVTRQVEKLEAQYRYVNAASLEELLDEISSGDHLAYEQRYGATAEAPLRDWDKDAPLRWISEPAFESVWSAARQELSGD